MFVSINVFIILILLIVFSLSVGGLKILLNNFFNFDSQPFLWIQYSLFYVVSYGIYLLVSFKFPSDNLSKVLTVIGIIVAEIAIFYFKYYILDSKLHYAIFIIFSAMANLLLLHIFVNIIGALLVLRFS